MFPRPSGGGQLHDGATRQREEGEEAGPEDGEDGGKIFLGGDGGEKRRGGPAVTRRCIPRSQERHAARRREGSRGCSSSWPRSQQERGQVA